MKGKRLLTVTRALPFTSTLSSHRNFTDSSALDLPKDDGSKKKFTPKSSSLTNSGSRIVN